MIAAIATEEEGEDLDITHFEKVEKTDDELARIETALKGNYIFKPLDDQQRQAAYSAIQKYEAAPGDIIYAAGDAASACYIVDSGEFT